MRRRLVVVLLAIIATSVTGQATAGAATRHDQLPLRLGSSGPRVSGLQWMISGPHGHRPNVFTVAGTFHGKPNGLYGARTAAAVYALKYRLGYPTKYNSKAHPIAGAYLFKLLRGQAHRPVAWVALAQQRVRLVEPGATKLALRIKSIEISQLGVRETCGGSCNRGPIVDQYQRYFGVLGLAWCAIFQQWSFAHAGYTPPFADRSFLVSYIADWARRHGYLTAKAKVGELVAFLDDGGHIGYVTKILAGGYVTVEGNASDSVKQVYHPWNDRLRVFIALPGVVA